MIEKLAIIEDILFRIFIIGFIFFVFSFLAYLLFNQQLMDLVLPLYGLKPETATIMMLSFYGLIKMFLAFCILIPAIAIHWTRKSLTKKEK